MTLKDLMKLLLPSRFGGIEVQLQSAPSAEENGKCQKKFTMKLAGANIGETSM